MSLFKTRWNKQSSDAVQFTPNTRYFQQNSIQDKKNQVKKSTKKVVRFDSQTPDNKPQTSDNAQNITSTKFRPETFIFEDHHPNLSSTNIYISEVPDINNRQLCSGRAIVITFIIIVFILIVTAIAIGIAFSTTKSQQNASEAMAGNNNQNSITTIPTTAILSIGSQTGLPCLSYTTINDPTRNVAHTSTYGTCDRGSLFNATNGGSWIRFVGTGGTTIPQTPTAVNHCGAFSSGWFNGTLPSTPGTVVNGTVCFATYLTSCVTMVDVAIIDCTGFLIYFLSSAPLCNARYCTT